MIPDRELLQRYTQNQDETAFTELVQRHLPAVYAAAFRLGGSNAHLAQDVAQATFTILAQRAQVLTEHATLAGWLHTTTRYLAHKAVREERRRRNREQEAVAMQAQDAVPESNMEPLRPLLDEAVGSLREDERNVLLLRFFHGKSHQEVAATLGLRENTANKRSERALEKLRKYFARRGVTTTLALLASAMEAQAAMPLPAGLTAQVAKMSLASTTAVGGFSHFIWKTTFMSTKTKIILTAAAVAFIAAIPLAIQQARIAQLKSELTNGGGQNTGVKIAGNSDPAIAGDGLTRLRRILAIKDSLEMMQQLTGLVGSLDARSIPPLLNYLVQLRSGVGPGANNNLLALSMLINRFVHLSPTSALQWAMAQPNHLGRASLVSEVFAAWANLNPHEALAEASQLQDPQLKQTVIAGIVANIISTDPTTALAALAGMPLNREYLLALSTAFQQWASQDPQAAMAAAMQLPVNRNRNRAVSSVISAWTVNDPQGLLAWAGGQPEGATRNSAIQSALKTMSQQNPQAALGYVANVTNVPLRNSLTVSVAGEWAQDDPNAAADWVLANTNGDTLRKSLNSIIGSLSSSDPQSAANLLDKMAGGGGTRISSMQQIAQNWAEIDPQADLNWLKYLDDASGTGTVSAVKSNAEANVVGTWAKNDPNAALAYVEGLGTESPQYNTMIAAIASAQASLDPAMAADWVQTITNDDARNGAINAVMPQLINTDPQAAVDLAKLMPAGPGQDTVYGKVIGAWSASDPAAAAGSLAQLPPGAALTSATEAVAANWIQSDPVAAANWVNNLPSGDSRDVAAREESKALTNVDPATAFNWATNIGDLQMRSAQARSVIQVWGRTDPAAAAAAVQASNLTDLGKSRMQALIQRNGPAQ